MKNVLENLTAKWPSVTTSKFNDKELASIPQAFIRGKLWQGPANTIRFYSDWFSAQGDYAVADDKRLRKIEL